MKLETVKSLILERANPKRKLFNEKLDPGQNKMYGLSIPKIREVAKLIYQDNPYEFLDANDYDSYELEQVHAMVITMLKDIDIALPYIEKFMPYIHGWSVNDTLCMHFKLARKHRGKVYTFLSQYFDSDKEFEQRVVAVMLLAHFLEDDYIDRVIEVLDHLKIDAYYSKMAVAWAFATIMAKYPDKGLSYMKQRSLDDWTYRKTIQKSIESFRVSDELKDTLRKMRNKK